MNDIPSDHPIRRVWRANRKLSSISGKIELAKEGDTYAARQLLALYVTLVRRRESCPSWRYPDPIPPELESYIADRFAQILKLKGTAKLAEKAGQALLITSGRKGGCSLTSAQEQELSSIGYRVACVMEENLAKHGKELKTKAAAAVAKEVGVSMQTALNAYETYMKVEHTEK